MAPKQRPPSLRLRLWFSQSTRTDACPRSAASPGSKRTDACPPTGVLQGQKTAASPIQSVSATETEAQASHRHAEDGRLPNRRFVFVHKPSSRSGADPHRRAKRYQYHEPASCCVICGTPIAKKADAYRRTCGAQECQRRLRHRNITEIKRRELAFAKAHGLCHTCRRRPKRRIGSRVYKTCSRCWRKRSAWEALKAAREAHEALALEAELRAADRRVDALRQAALRRKAAELLAQLEANRLRKDDRPLELAPPLEA